MTKLHSHGKPVRAHLPFWLVVCLLSGIAVFLLWTDHDAHSLSVLPYLLLLACPLLHLFLRWRQPHGPHHPRGTPEEHVRPREPSR